MKLKMLTMSAVDFLDEWFESPILKASMSISGIIGTFMGVRSPGTVGPLRLGRKNHRDHFHPPTRQGGLN